MHGMDTNQTKIIELFREVHLIAIKEMERLNLRIAELESSARQVVPEPAKPTAVEQPKAKPSSTPKHETGLLNEHEVAAYLNISVGTIRRWRLFRTGPKFVKVGAAVRYKREDLETWLESCPGLR